MSVTDKKFYFWALYLTLGFIAAANVFFALSGNVASFYSLLVQVAVFFCAFLRKPWSFWVVAIWSSICIVGAAAMWVAVLARGSFSMPSWVVIYKTILLVICIYLISAGRDAFAPDVLSEVRSDED